MVSGRYRLERRLGQGGFGDVFLAEDLHQQHRGPLAVKVLSSAGQASTHVRRRFAAEARVLLTIRHPNVVRAFDFGDGPEGLFLVMEYLPGRALMDLLTQRSREGRRFSLAELRTIFSQLAAGVAAAHAAGAVHRDLKPANVMLVAEGTKVRVKVLDFGIAKLLGTGFGDQTTLGRMVGSYLYMSPEQALGATVDARADVFALGTLLFELATLRRAWASTPEGSHLPIHQAFRLEGQNALVRVLERIVRGQRPRISPHCPDLPEALDEALSYALATQAEDRCPTVERLAALVEAAFEPVEPTLIHHAGPVEADLTPLISSPSDLAWAPLEAPAAAVPPPIGPRSHGPLRRVGMTALLVGFGAAGGAAMQSQFGAAPPPPRPALLDAPAPEADAPSPVLHPTATRAEAPAALLAGPKEPEPVEKELRASPAAAPEPRRPGRAAPTPRAEGPHGLRGVVEALGPKPTPAAFASAADRLERAASTLPIERAERVRRLVFTARTSGDRDRLRAALDVIEGR